MLAVVSHNQCLPVRCFPLDMYDQVGLDTCKEHSGYASVVIGNEGRVNKMFATKKGGVFGEDCAASAD